jgi:hypothetical protein
MLLTVYNWFSCRQGPSCNVIAMTCLSSTLSIFKAFVAVDWHGRTCKERFLYLCCYLYWSTCNLCITNRRHHHHQSFSGEQCARKSLPVRQSHPSKTSSSTAKQRCIRDVRLYADCGFVAVQGDLAWVHLLADLPAEHSMLDAYWPLVAVSSLPALLLAGKAATRLAGRRPPPSDDRCVLIETAVYCNTQDVDSITIMCFSSVTVCHTQLGNYKALHHWHYTVTRGAPKRQLSPVSVSVQASGCSARLEQRYDTCGNSS